MALGPTEKISDDVILATQICEKLLAGERKCLRELFTAFNGLFQSFARRRLFNPGSHEDVVQSFWEEMLTGQAICAYAQNAENKATLRTYLLGILYRRIIDANRKTSKSREIHQGDEDFKDTQDQRPTPQNGLVASTSKNLIRRLVNETLLKLSEESPTDASLVRMHLEGLDYSQMAERLGKRSDAVKKQFTREPTGSLAKFKRALKQAMLAQGLRYEDL